MLLLYRINETNESMHKQAEHVALLARCYLIRLWQLQITLTQSALIFPKPLHIHYRGYGQNLCSFLPNEMVKFRNIFKEKHQLHASKELIDINV